MQNGTAQHPCRNQMSTVQVKLSKRVVDRALAFKPDYDSNTAHLSRLIESAIDSGNTLGKPTAGRGEVLPSSSLNKEEERARAELVNRPPSPPSKPAGDPFTKKAISLELIPDDLLDDSDLLLDFWKVKKGTRSQRAWNGLVSKLRGMNAADRTKALTAAYEGGWATVYEPRSNTPTQASVRPVGIIPNQPLSEAMQAWIQS